MAPATIVMVAGEASGDLHAAHVIRALRRRREDIFVCGVGGSCMQAAGARILIDARQLAVVGITEALAKAPRLLRALARLKRLLRGLRPDLLVLIDFPDFNLHLAGFAKKLRIPVLYYISPQIWAWRSQRVKKIKARVDHMAVILPFEKPFYEKHGVPVSFVGHPLLDSLMDRIAPQPVPGAASAPMVALLPGSRDSEVTRLLPIMLRAARILRTQMENLCFTISCAPTIDRALVDAILAQEKVPAVTVESAPVATILQNCHLAIAASGTVTLEVAISGTPMIIAYVVSAVSYWLGRMLIDVEHIGLVNLIAQQRIVPELIQSQATAETIAVEAQRLLSDPAACARMAGALQEVRRRLGQPGASERVAEIASGLMERAHVV